MYSLIFLYKVISKIPQMIFYTGWFHVTCLYLVSVIKMTQYTCTLFNVMKINYMKIFLFILLYYIPKLFLKQHENKSDRISIIKSLSNLYSYIIPWTVWFFTLNVLYSKVTHLPSADLVRVTRHGSLIFQCLLVIVALFMVWMSHGLKCLNINRPL